MQHQRPSKSLPYTPYTPWRLPWSTTLQCKVSMMMPRGQRYSIQEGRDYMPRPRPWRTCLHHRASMSKILGWRYSSRQGLARKLQQKNQRRCRKGTVCTSPMRQGQLTLQYRMYMQWRLPWRRTRTHTAGMKTPPVTRCSTLLAHCCTQRPPGWSRCQGCIAYTHRRLQRRTAPQSIAYNYQLHSRNTSQLHT